MLFDAVSDVGSLTLYTSWFIRPSKSWPVVLVLDEWRDSLQIREANYGTDDTFDQRRYTDLQPREAHRQGDRVGLRTGTDRGKYVALLDDDDEFLTHKLLVQVPILESRSDIGVVYGQSVVTGGNTPLLMWPQSGPSGRVFEEFLTRTDDFLHPPTWLVRRELFEKAGYFDESKAGMEHYDIALRIAFYADWLFLSGGPVARGRFSKTGLWFSTILDGTNEKQLPMIIERALAMLPDTTESARVRRKARAAVCATIAGQQWINGGGVEATRIHLLTALEKEPWMLEEPEVLAWLYRVAGALASGSRFPLKTVKHFWKEIRLAVKKQGISHLLQVTGLLGDLLRESAIHMRANGSPRAAILTGAIAFLCRPYASIQAKPSRGVAAVVAVPAILL